MSIIQKPTAVIFDFDDTLVDAKPIIKRSLQATFDRFNIDKEVIQTKDIDVNMSLRDYFHKIFENNLNEARESYYSFYDEFSKDLKTLENAEDVLRILNNNNVYTAVVSNKNSARLRNEINNKLAWSHYFDSIVGSGDASEDKPSPLPAKLALQNLNLDNYQDVWLIGDSMVDIRTANNLGCIGILFKTELKEKPDDIKLHKAVSSHLELLELLKEIYD